MTQQPFQRNDITRASLGGHFPDNPYNALSDRMASGLGLYDYNRSRSPGRTLDEQPPQQNYYQNYYNDYGQFDHYGDYQQQPQYYNGYNNQEEPGYGYTRQPQASNSGYSPQQNPGYRAGSLPRAASGIRKESTSFEHSEPLPGNLTRWPQPQNTRKGEAYVELTVTLQRHDSGFGFRIVGGTEEGSQVSVS